MIGKTFRITLIVVYALLLLSCIFLALLYQSFSLAEEQPPVAQETWATQDQLPLEVDGPTETQSALEMKREELALALRDYYLGQGSEEDCRRLIAETRALMEEENGLDELQSI